MIWFTSAADILRGSLDPSEYRQPVMKQLYIVCFYSWLMSFKDKIMYIIAAHSKLVTLGIGLAITFVIGTAIGMVDHNQVFALRVKPVEG
jgi:hypothetical protein